MFRSIRWRLVVSYVVLTLVTVTLMGAVALSLVDRYARQQEEKYLTANAEAIARQASTLMQPVVRRSNLSELAHTAAFLGNVRVRILDASRQVLVDSGPRDQMNDVVWIVPQAGIRVEPSNESFGGSVILIPSGQLPGFGRSSEESPVILQHLPSGANSMVARRVEGTFGSRLVFDTLHDWRQFPTPPTETQPNAAAPANDTTQTDGETPRSGLTITHPIGDAAAPIGYVELSHGPDLRVEALRTTRQAILLAAAGATLVAALMGLLVSRGLTSPLGELALAADEMSAGNLATRAQVRGDDEIGQLARQFNQMAEGLEASFADLAAERDALRRFIADASHELRTPITALKTFNELLRTRAPDALARAEFLSESEVQLNRLEWITHNLLDLSRLDAGLINLDVAEHDAGEIVETTAAGFRALAQEKGVALVVEPPPAPTPLRCDRARIEMALSNLLDNALKFTPAGGRVSVQCSVNSEQYPVNSEQTATEKLFTDHCSLLTDDCLLITVEDTGPGIDPEDQAHIFERFYRGKRAGEGGSGLGLAIVQSVVRAHSGEVFVESEMGHGSRFVMALPAG